MPCLPLHYIRKRIHWLVEEHQQAGTCRVEWETMTLRELSKIMPDQHDHLTEIGDEANVAEVAEVLQVHPMLISCRL
jgi:hypothetical protein